MKFKVTRTSRYSGESPCEEAKKETVKINKVDYRTCKTLDEVREKFWGKQWLAVGTNHRECKIGVARNLPEQLLEAFFIELNSLDELVAFSKKYGELVLSIDEYYTGDVFPEIEIYDDYRE